MQARLVVTKEYRAVIQQPGRLYVVDNLRHLTKAMAGDQSWWCVDKHSRVGEQSAIYLKGRGVKVLFQVSGDPKADESSFCLHYLMATAEVAIVAVLDPPLSASGLRSDAVLSGMHALNRNFQGTSFRLPTLQFEHMRKLSSQQTQKPVEG